MSGKSDGGRRRSASFRSEMHTPKNNGGKSFMRGRAPTMPSLKRPSTPVAAPSVPPATPATPSTLRVAVAAAAATPPMVRATLASSAGSPRDPRKFPAAANSTITTPSVHATSVSRLPPKYIPDTMSSRKLDGVHSLSALLEKQSQEPALSQSKSKFARGSQSKAKVEKKFDPRADDTDEEEDTSSSDDSDGDTPAVPSAVNKLNGQTSSSKPAGTPLKKAKRAKEDEVSDSDVERKTSSAKPASTTKKTPVKPESSSEESSDSEAEAEASDSSDSSSESESESNKKPAPKVPVKVAPTNGASTTSSSGSESESEDEAAKRTRSAAKPTVNGTKVVEPSTSSSEASSSEEESGDEEEEDEDDDDGSRNEEASSDEESDDNAVAVTARRNSNDLTVPGFVGKDFVLRKAQGDEDGKDMSDFFAKAKLDGKQLWYFTVPASIPINVVEKLQIPMDKAQNGDAIFKHHSEDYTVGFDVGSTAVQLLIPNKKGTRYEQASQKVDKVLHVKRVTQLVGEPRAPRPNQPNAARPQPPGLKARFRPIGVSDDTPLGSIGLDASPDNDEDVDMAPAPALPSSSKKSKRASTQGDAMDIDEPTSKATKKDKKSKTVRDPVQNSQSTDIEVPNSQPLTSKKDKKSKKRRDSFESISSVGSNPKSALLKGQKVAAATPDQSKKASKRKVPADEEDASAQLAKEAASAEKKAKKPKRDADSSALGAGQASAKKVTAIPPPTIPTASYSFSNIPPGSSPTPQTSTPLPKSKSKSSKKSKSDELAIRSSSQTASARKETPIQPTSVRRESAVPLPQVPFQSSPAAEETPKKEKHKRRKSEKTEEPKSAKKETPIPAPKV
ncbi:DNA-directed RNA polymerase I subunit [Colletotrichum graminicola]|uniref:DNA-directed RNA polymerase I subunit n=1 Tax=Colletotrichum graminicola (strain M1.001 / M2 / FGSC 10212) TaxID=645133 RepID=E3QLI5_COLGM|nr:DNA-directed RNA polymerase I subunit [Colletotrichum graminicola M1.001]EFQ31723.1 DNA-directed RNA polymerase I subunit [Colletotrichum graminicola M1.001]WDK13460.1 DNA-directed RNA polymerase I subunit [Colletotrichum graminicola]